MVNGIYIDRSINPTEAVEGLIPIRIEKLEILRDGEIVETIVHKKSQIPSLIPGYEEECPVVIGCCGFVARMHHIYP